MNNIQAVAGVVVKELYRRKDFYVLFILTALITLVFGSVNFFNEVKIVRALKEICLFLIWVAALVIAVTTAARQIPFEKENRTLQPLLAKPITRNQLVFGKFCGCWVATGISLLVFYFFFAVISGAREHEWPLANYFQQVTLHWFMLGVVTAMALWGSIVFAAPSSNTTIILVVVSTILLLGRHLGRFALNLGEPAHTLVYGLYFLIPHLEFYDVRDLIIHNWEPVPWLVWLAALGYAAVYVLLFLAATCAAFRRKPVN